MPSVELHEVRVRFPLYGAWNRSLLTHLLAAPTRSSRVGTDALCGISLSLRGGQHLAILGANGSGKTSLARVIAGLVRPCSGSVTIVGRPFATLSLGCASHPDATVSDTIVLHGLLAGRSQREARHLAHQVLAFGALTEYAEQTVTTLSSGNVFRLGISTALFLQADIIVLDEVMDSTDPGFVRQVKDYLEIHRQDAIIVVVERLRALLDGFCDRAIVLEKGLIIDQGAYDQVLRRNEKRYMF